MGGTSKNVKQNICCAAKQISDDEVEVYPLNQNDEPMGKPEIVQLKESLRDFTFLPYFRERKEAEKEKKINKKIATAEEHASF